MRLQGLVAASIVVNNLYRAASKIIRPTRVSSSGGCGGVASKYGFI